MDNNTKSRTLCLSSAFNKVSFDDLKHIVFEKDERDGYVYLIQIGEKVKIGSTKNLYSRIRSLKHIFEDYNGIKTKDIYISVPHANYTNSEKNIHNALSNKRVYNTELFDVCIKEAVEAANQNIDLDERTDKNKDGVLEYLINDLLKSKNSEDVDLSRMTMDEINYGIELLEQYKEVREKVVLFFTANR